MAEHLIINNPRLFNRSKNSADIPAHMEQKLKLFTRDVNVITLPFGLKSFCFKNKDTYVVQISPF